MLLAYHRAHGYRLVEWVSHDQSVYVGRQNVNDLAGPTVGNQDAGIGGACLSPVLEHGVFEASGKDVEVGIGEHNGCGLSSELQGDSLETAAGDLTDRLTCCSRSGEGDLVDIGMGYKSFACMNATGNDVEDARW
ncbi:hypothetical protein Y013_12955 [Rhodococcus pyridinivorans SB3094]|uniref:Uncharacterized protein n=1 Tax=Rhodococcus pyridinivorans SB3094 TaxID=1435356 RepID=V9XN02_9NOCA|nr:hypothetical protein Y013_12955 [Rhodococcus pyridinivorans SB3094]